MSEALYRLLREREDIAHIYKRLKYAGVTLKTLAEGSIETTELKTISAPLKARRTEIQNRLTTEATPSRDPAPPRRGRGLSPTGNRSARRSRATTMSTTAKSTSSHTTVGDPEPF